VAKATSDLPSPAASRRTSGAEAALYIRRLIFDGLLRPGDRVPQDEVARALGISRIPIREGLIALEREGWVTLELHRGAFINALDARAVQDHYELYGLIYGFAAGRALARSDGSLAGRLGEITSELAVTEDPAEVGRLTLLFHHAVVDAAQSPRIKVALRSLSSLVPGEFFELVPGAIEGEKKGLESIRRAVRRGDGTQAAEAYSRMMRRQGELVVKVFAARGLFGTPGSPGR
jgi:DNA-binding GntR family transcriptional regulator